MFIRQNICVYKIRQCPECSGRKAHVCKGNTVLLLLNCLTKMLTLLNCSFTTAYDKFSNELKSSLSVEKQKNSLLSEELKIKKGTVERLRSDLENVKEQLQYVKEEKSE